MAVFGALERRRFLRELEQGATRTAACSEVGVTFATVRRIIREDHEFAQDVADAEAIKVEAVEQALFATALKGNVEAQKFYLTNRAREEWANRQSVEHTGRDGGPIAIATAATIALQNVLSAPDTRIAALDFIETELAPTKELDAGSE